jgi:predicted nucleic-acid-binding Zn-ribbon protein
MTQQDKIIVLRNFDTSLEANLAKTKLDAYGIPCFLTGENLSNLYPVNNPKFSGVRLHLFSKDEVQARQILSEVVPTADEELTRCPRCRSANIELTYTKKFNARIFTILITIFLALFPLRKVYRCLDCEHEF